MALTVRINSEESGSPWGRALEADAAAALDLAERRMGVALDAPPLVRSLSPEAAFYAELGERPHELLAVALPANNEIVVNRVRYLQLSGYEKRQVLVHEFSHLILGRCVPSAVPRWLDEGVAMLVARESNMEGSIRVATAASFGGLVRLDDLWGGERSGMISQDLSYAESLSATRYFLSSGAWGPYGSQDDLADFIRKLSHPTQGRALRDLLNDPGFIRAFERQWRQSLRSIWSWIAALTSGTFFWMGMAGLVLLAYWRKRRLAEAIESEWAAEEKASVPDPGGEPSPGEANVEDVLSDAFVDEE